MPVQFTQKDNGKNLEVIVTGKLTAEDYHRFVPEFEKLVRQHGKISVLFDMLAFEGWDIRALWEDIRFDTKHFADIDKLAMVGDKQWEKWMSDFCRPFTKANIRFFEPTEIPRARQWIAARPGSAEEVRVLE